MPMRQQQRTLELCLNVPQEILLVLAHEDMAHTQLPLRTCQSTEAQLVTSICHSMHFMG